MAKTRIVDNRERPAQPEPDQDPALHTPPVREQAREVKQQQERPEREAKRDHPPR